MTNHCLRTLLPVLLAPALALPAALQAQMVSPKIDKPNEPFSYYSKPTDEIGMMDAEGATEVTPEGYLRTGFAELMFFTGPEMEPVNQRVKTLGEGHLPIIHYSCSRDGIAYHFTLFAATYNGRPEDGLVNFVRVQMRNIEVENTRAIFATAVRYDAPRMTDAAHGGNRFDRPREGRFPGDYRQIGETFSKGWLYGFDANHFTRDGKVVYSFPAGEDSRGFTIYGYYNYPQDTSKPKKLDVDETTPVGVVRYSKLLEPGETWTLDFRMPLVPTADPAQIALIDGFKTEAKQSEVRGFWQGMISQGMQINLPERKVVDTFDANLVYDLIARDHIGDDYIQTVNKLHYHSFFLRDGADIVHSYDVTGYPQIAEQDLRFFAKSQKPDGNFLSQEQQYDGWGEAVWGYAQHYRLTRDKAFAEWAIPQIDRAVDWLRKARATDPLHIMPASDVRDNEFVPGHLTGYNFLALSGLKLAVEMANDTGHARLAHKWQAEEEDYRKAFFAVLDQRAKENDGYIPPALDGQKEGYDWGNLLAVVPEPTLAPDDLRVAATLARTQAKYKEGIMTYADGEFLHHYLTMKNTLTEVIRGDQQQALSELYAILMHTSSTHAGFEFAILPWGDRNFEDNLAPHGWFAAEYRTLLRSMLVREEGDELHLLSVVSPEWVGVDKTIGVSNAPTYFGTVAYTLEQPTANDAVLHLDAQFTHAPKEIVLHLPWFMNVKSASADGKPVEVKNGALHLSADTKLARIVWEKSKETPPMSYQHTVEEYKIEYARRYNELMHGH